VSRSSNLVLLDNKISTILFKSFMVLCFFFSALQVARAEDVVIKSDGSSTVFPITEAAAYEFQKTSGVRVTVGISGTGGGFKKFCDGQTDLQNASRPITKEEMAKCQAKGIKYIELPIAYDALVVVVNKASPMNSISIDELKKIWEPSAKGVIQKWNQVNSSWADAPMKLYGAGTDSGTFDYFTEAVVGKAKSSRPDYTASEDDNTLVTGVANDKFGMGYFGYSYFEQNKSKLKALAILGGEKAPLKTAVLPSAETVKNATYFPLSRPLFIYISAESLKTKPEVKKFVQFYIDGATRFSEKAKYVALPKKAYDLASEHLKKEKLGSVFAGESKIGIKVEDLLKLEVQL
jgi:phosphate transport system substrate-binding protein